MRVMVLGAGVVGTTAAWYLARAGHTVTVLDRREDAALETSFANGGQISVSHAEPWANPGAPATILKWLGREDAPLLFRLRADARQWSWGLRFLLECLPSRTLANTRAILALGLYSRAELQRLRAEARIEYDAQTRGILHFYTDPREYERAARHADDMRAFGMDRVLKTAAECVAIEPALARSTVPLAGGDYTASDESGDARKFTQALARRAMAFGVSFRFGCAIQRLQREGDRIAGVAVAGPDGREELVCADAYVLALGAYSAPLARPVGVALPIYPAKGYSLTLPLDADDLAPVVSLTDEAHKIVFSRLGQRLRVAGTAELNGYDTTLNPVRCEALLTRTAQLFPQVGDRSAAQFWTGLRPATPSNVPIIGRSRLRNLYLDTGHGTLGWTLACGSGRALADMVSGEAPEVDFPFTGLPETLRRRTSVPVAARGPREKQPAE
jgi:D-amino-acid dehydrogenase